MYDNAKANNVKEFHLKESKATPEFKSCFKTEPPFGFREGSPLEPDLEKDVSLQQLKLPLESKSDFDKRSPFNIQKESMFDFKN